MKSFFFFLFSSILFFLIENTWFFSSPRILLECLSRTGHHPRHVGRGRGRNRDPSWGTSLPDARKPTSTAYHGGVLPPDFVLSLEVRYSYIRVLDAYSKPAPFLLNVFISGLLPGVGKFILSLLQSWRLAHFSAKGQVVTVSGSASHVVCPNHPALLSYCASGCPQRRNEWAWLCSRKTLFTKTGSGLDLAGHPSLATPALSH